MCMNRSVHSWLGTLTPQGEQWLQVAPLPPWAAVFCQAPLTSPQVGADYKCRFFKQKGTTYGRTSSLKKDKAMHRLLKHRDKPFPASPVLWSLNVMLCPPVLSAMRSSILREWLQIKVSHSTWQPWLNCLLFKDQGC